MEASTIKVLLIEDDPDDAELIRGYLGETDDVRIELQQVGLLSHGLERLEAERFDVVLLDLSLPDSWGLETFRRAYAAKPDVPIVLMTGAEVIEIAHSAIREGAADCLFKGQMDGPSLVRAIRYAIERSRRR